ncbi:MAG: hypothetical protein ACHWZW_01580 [Spirulina sp.]
MSPDTPLNTATLLPDETAPQPSLEDAAETTVMNPAGMVSTYADTLMGSLFGDLERLLDGDETALAAVEEELKAPPSPDEAALQPLPTPAAAPDPGQDRALAAPITTLVPAVEPPTTPDAPPKTRMGLWLDRLLLACTACSLAGVVALLWFGQRPEGTPPSDSVADSVASAGQSDAEFLAYLQRSLDAIEKQVAQAQTEAPQAQALLPHGSLLPPGGLTLPSQGSSLGLPGRINVIERVYIPYQATPPALPTAPPSLGSPSMAGSLPATPIVPAPGSAATPSQPAAPVVNHVLVGVLELGDRSAALFEINGVSQRVYMGERIGNAGWSLVSVSNQEAVIRRNGEVRSIYIGQQF